MKKYVFLSPPYLPFHGILRKTHPCPTIISLNSKDHIAFCLKDEYNY